MYEIISLNGQFNQQTPCVVLLGGFDGAHVGHASLFRAAKSYGLPVGVMSIAGGKGKGLFTLDERRDIFSSLGANFMLQMRFEDIQTLSPKQFLDGLMEQLQIRAFVCGTDFHFGFQAAGDIKFLKEYTQGRVEIQNLIEKSGEKIATTTIKHAVEQGDVKTANELLVLPFFIKGKVEKDRGIGKTINFPTANILYPKDKFPIKQGVYHTQTQIDGKTYQAITNYGARPTFDNDRVVTETHIIGFTGDLYNQTLKVEFVRYLRDVQKFENVEQLQEQLRRDVAEVSKNEN